MVRQPLSAISNSAAAKRTNSGRTRKAPKRLIEEQDKNTKENISCNNAKVCNVSR